MQALRPVAPGIAPGHTLFAQHLICATPEVQPIMFRYFWQNNDVHLKCEVRGAKAAAF